MMNLDLLGLLLAIPLAIVANLITPKISAAIGGRSGRSGRSGRRRKSGWKRNRHLEEELALITNLATNAEKLTQHLFTVFLKAAVVLMVVSIATDVMWMLMRVFGELFYIGSLSGLIYALDIVGAVVVVRIVMDGLRDLDKVRNFEEYKAFVRRELGRPDDEC